MEVALEEATVTITITTTSATEITARRINLNSNLMNPLNLLQAVKGQIGTREVAL